MTVARAIDVVMRVEAERQLDDANTLRRAIEAALEAEAQTIDSIKERIDYTHGRKTWGLVWDATVRRRAGLRYPTSDEADVCDVARDLVEEGRLDKARALLDAGAPNRLGRTCPSCGEHVGSACIDMAAPEPDFGRRSPLLVPHEARMR